MVLEKSSFFCFFASSELNILLYHWLYIFYKVALFALVANFFFFLGKLSIVVYKFGKGGFSGVEKRGPFSKWAKWPKMGLF
jgi:hypothetical protein